MLDPSLGIQKHIMKNLDISNQISNSPIRQSPGASPEFRRNLNHNPKFLTDINISNGSPEPSAWENRIHIKPLGSFRNIESENVFGSTKMLGLIRDPIEIREYHDKSRKRKYHCIKYRRIFPIDQKSGTVERLKQENIDWVRKNQQSYSCSRLGLYDYRHRVIHDDISKTK
jgi:hypothetical protein